MKFYGKGIKRPEVQKYAPKHLHCGMATGSLALWAAMAASNSSKPEAILLSMSSGRRNLAVPSLLCRTPPSIHNVVLAVHAHAQG